MPDRRWRARLSLAAVALSAALAIATAVLWIRSYRHDDLLVRQRGPADHLCISSEFGLIVIEIEASQQGVIRPEWSYFDTPLPRRFRRRDGVLGFAAYRDANRHYVRLPPTTVWGISLPHPFVIALFLIGPALGIAGRHRRAVQAARRSRGLCVRCGYDLRATLHRCPECGLERR